MPPTTAPRPLNLDRCTTTAAPRPLHHLQAFTVNWGLLLVLWVSAAEPALIWCDEGQRGSRGRVQKKHKPALCTRFGSLVKLQTRGAKISLCIKSSDELHKEKNFKEKTAKFKTGRAYFKIIIIYFVWMNCRTGSKTDLTSDVHAHHASKIFWTFYAF